MGALRIVILPTPTAHCAFRAKKQPEQHVEPQNLCYTIPSLKQVVTVMCGRYQFTEQQSEEILQIIQEVQDKVGAVAAQAVPCGEIKPGSKMPVLLPTEGGHPTPELMVWGFLTPKKSLLINARAETAMDKPTFADSVRYRHCVVPSTGFYERDGDRRDFFFTCRDSAALYMAGIYDVRDGVPCYCILTTAPNDSMRDVHDRMPLVLEREQIVPWLYDLAATEQFLKATPTLLERRLLDTQIGLW